MTLFFPSRTPSCSLIFPLALFSNIETENLPVSVQEILGKKLRGIRYPHFPVGFTLQQKHNLQSKSSQIISWEGKKLQLILILSCTQPRCWVSIKMFSFVCLIIPDSQIWPENISRSLGLTWSLKLKPLVAAPVQLKLGQNWVMSEPRSEKWELLRPLRLCWRSCSAWESWTGSTSTAGK